MPWVLTPAELEPAPSGTPTDLGIAAVGGVGTADVPHLAYPLRYANGVPVVNEQDSLNDIADCVAVICLTEPGDRDELPQFGVTDPFGGQQPLNTSAILRQITAWEPRATLLAEQAPDLLDTAIANIEIDVGVTS